MRRFTGTLLAIPLLGAALPGCGTTTVDPKSGEKLIRDYVKRSQSVTLKSVSCPSGIKPKDGTSFDCKVAVLPTGGGPVHSGTISVHIASGAKKVEILGPQDIHLK